MSGIVGNNTNRGSGIVKAAVVGADTIDGSNIADDAIDSEHYTDGSIDEAHIADNAVTLAKMAGGTDGNIISYDASGDPVAIATGDDGQVLTSAGAGAPPVFEDAGGGVTKGTIGGLTCSNDTDASHDILISVGSARDYADAVTMSLTTQITKRIDAAWAVGDDNGGLDTGSVGANTGYGVWLIRRSDTGVVDAIFSLDKGAAGATLTKPTNYDQIRLIGWVRTDGSSNIISFFQSDDYFRLIGVIPADIADSTMTNNTYEDGTLTVPPLTNAEIFLHVDNPTTTDGHMRGSVKTKGGADVVATNGANFMMHQNAQARDRMAHQGVVFVDASSVVEYACTESSGTATLNIYLMGDRKSVV